MAHGVLTRKPVADMIEQSQEEAHRLRPQALGRWDLAALGIGAIVGTGIFVLSGVGATMAGPAVILSFVVAGIASALAALCYAELAGSVPVTGSSYTFTYATLGELIAWVIGWDFILEYGVGSGAVAIGWSGYLASIFESVGVHLPTALLHGPFDSVQPGIVNLPAVGILLLVAWLVSSGVNQSRRVNNVIVIVKLLAVVLFIVVGSFFIHPANYTPFMPYGWGGVMTGAAIIFYAYIGFDSVATATEEARDSRHSIPFGILVSLGVCTLLYLLVAFVSSGLLPAQAYRGQAAPLAYALQHVGQGWAAGAISIGALAGLSSVMLVGVFSGARVLFAMSRDGLLPKGLAKVHEARRTPQRVIWLGALISSICAGLLPINVVAELTNVGTLAAFTLVSIGVLVLRYTQPDLPRTYRVPGVPVVPLLAAAASIYLIVSLPVLTLIRFGVWLLLGFLVYFLYSRKHSRIEEKILVTTQPSMPESNA
ncbi:MAG: amino acid permease [Firmicutes bacterium]|nr:amino acid permease [Bacillota bacterium]